MPTTTWVGRITSAGWRWRPPAEIPASILVQPCRLALSATPARALQSHARHPRLRREIAVTRWSWSRSLAAQAVGECGERVGKLSRGFRWRQRDFEILRTGGRIALDPWMRRGVGIVGCRQTGQ